MHVRGDAGIPVPDTGYFPLMASKLTAPQGPLFGEETMSDSDLCLHGGGDGYS